MTLLAAISLLWAAPEPDDIWVQAEDGGFLALHRRANPGKPPVLLCHGISSNHRFWDLAPDRSLAVHLWEEGFDVWNMDLRGHGDALHAPEGKRQRPGWNIDTYGLMDFPAAMAHIQEETGEPQLHYVGHSMGGMVLAVHLATAGQEGLASAVIVASPLDFRDADALTVAMLHAAKTVRGLPFLPSPMGARYLGLAGRSAPLALDELVLNPDNYSRHAERLTLRTVVSPLSKGEIQQFLMMYDGEFRSADGQMVYREHLADVTIPMLFFAGRADRIVTPDSVWTFYESVGSQDRSFVLMSKSNGFQADYGHLDFGDSDYAREEVFPQISAWMKAH
jgi:polyhydroxyalkanoate synthase